MEIRAVLRFYVFEGFCEQLVGGERRCSAVKGYDNGIGIQSRANEGLFFGPGEELSLGSGVDFDVTTLGFETANTFAYGRNLGSRCGKVADFIRLHEASPLNKKSRIFCEDPGCPFLSSD
jgi:hypothetical protein